MIKDNFVAHYAANNESETFKTFEEAEKWLKDQWADDASEGYSEETCNGYDYIAEITHCSNFKITQDREKDGYRWNEEAGGYFIDGNPDEEEWCSESDQLGEIELVALKQIEAPKGERVRK